MDRCRGPIMAWNFFRCCTVLRALGSIMIIVVLGLVGFTYYAVVLADYGPALCYGGLDSFTAFAVLALFHALLVMLLWSYFSVVLTDPGGVPPNWRPKIDEERSGVGLLVESVYIAPTLASNDFGVLGELGNQNKGYCRKCNQFKPPRSHHCSVCGRCVLKMDHHCIWVVNCVGALNYKYFLLFLFYTFLETTLVTLSLLPYFMAFFSDVEIFRTPASLAVSFITFILNLAFAISIMGFMVMHMLLIASNTTTIEAFEKNTTTKWSYNLGWKNNYEQVFGTKKRFWLIPTYSSEDLKRMPALQGLEYPIVLDVELETLQPL